MIKRYTFLNHPFCFVLENAKSMVNGLDKCVGVYYDEYFKAVKVIEVDNSLSSLDIGNHDLVNEIRKPKERFNWIQPSQVPFEVSENKIGQLSFKDEEKSSVLELRFKSKIDSGYDVLYFYFKNNIGNFKLATSNEVMTVVVKEVIQNLLYNQVSVLLNSKANDLELYNKVASSKTNDVLQSKIDELEQRGFDQNKDSYTYVLNKLIGTESFEVVLSMGAVQRISEITNSLQEVEMVLQETIEVLLNSTPVSSFYELSKNDIVFTGGKKEVYKTVKLENLEKTILFLDKYEAAAKLVLSRSEKVTGLNIGNNCYPKVSPAAISDVFKKHQSKIVQLLNQYPNKWSSIRAHYKPLKSIASKSAYSSGSVKFSA